MRIVVVGTLGGEPYAGTAWQAMQIVLGFLRLGHDAWYFEVTSTWPYDPTRQSRVADGEYAIAHVARVARRFGIEERWAYYRSYGDQRWFGLQREQAETLLAQADLVFNLSGATVFAREALATGRLVLYGTDPVIDEVNYANGDADTRRDVDQHDDVLTFGENIGTAGCAIPPLPRMRGHTRQPIALDLWHDAPPAREVFTTVGNWKQGGLDVTYGGDTYRWSKHHEFLKFIDAPAAARLPLELATNLAFDIDHADDVVVPALGFHGSELQQLLVHGWRVVDGPGMSEDLQRYRDYIAGSLGEFTVARDLNVRLRSGWFSDRSACYLAAGRPVITQDTGFGRVLPTGEGLFAFNSMDDIRAAFDAVRSDYERHSRAAREIAVEYFAAERVLAKALADLGA